MERGRLSFSFKAMRGGGICLNYFSSPAVGGQKNKREKMEGGDELVLPPSPPPPPPTDLDTGEEREVYDLRFVRGATHLVVGASASGKTVRTSKILRLKDRLLENGEEVKNIIYCFAAWQPIYDELKRDGVVTRWINKMPTNEEFVDMVRPYHKRGGSIVVLDDFLTSVGKDMMDIVCVSSRHYDVSTFILFQTLFPPDKSARTITRNVKYMHVHKNPRDNSQIRFLASQISPGDFHWIVKAYHAATKEPHSCFLVDLTQKCPDRLRFRSHYLPEEAPMRVWCKA